MPICKSSAAVNPRRLEKRSEARADVATSARRDIADKPVKVSLADRVGLALILAVLIIATAPWMFGAKAIERAKSARRI